MYCICNSVTYFLNIPYTYYNYYNLTNVQYVDKSQEGYLNINTTCL